MLIAALRTFVLSYYRLLQLQEQSYYFVIAFLQYLCVNICAYQYNRFHLIQLSNFGLLRGF